MMRLALFVLVAGLVGFRPAHADDRKRVALLEFDGPRSANVRGEVMRVAATKCWIASPSKLDGRSIRDFAAEHDVDLVVDGSVARRGRDYQIRIRFLRGSTGRSIASATANLRQPALDRPSRRRVERELDRALAAIPPRPNSDEIAADATP